MHLFIIYGNHDVFSPNQVLINTTFAILRLVLACIFRKFHISVIRCCNYPLVLSSNDYSVGSEVFFASFMPDCLQLVNS